MAREEARRRGRRPKQNAKATQVNVRMEPALKEAGDAVLGRLGLSSSEAVRALYEYLVREQDLPEGLLPDRGATAAAPWAAEGAGMARKLLLDAAAPGPEGVGSSHGDDA